MPDQVFRIKSRDMSALGGRLAAHVLGDSRPDTALPRDDLQPVEMLVGGHEAMKEAAEFIKVTPRHHRAAPAVEALFAGPPAYEDDAVWSKKAVDAWARDSVAWLQRRLEHSILYAAVLHQDEGAPHCHCLLVPLSRSKVVSWRQANAEALGREPPKTPQELSALGQAWQDSYHEEVGRHHGLGRGEKGSKRRHTAIDRAKAATMRASEAKKIALQAAGHGLELMGFVNRMAIGAFVAIRKPWTHLESLAERLMKQFERVRLQVIQERQAADQALAAAKQLDPEAAFELGLHAGIESATDAAEDWAHNYSGDHARFFSRSGIVAAAYSNAPEREEAARDFENEFAADSSAGQIGPARDAEPAQDITPKP